MAQRGRSAIMRTCEGCGAVVMTSLTQMRGGRRLCPACRATMPGGIKRTPRNRFVPSDKPTPTDLENARVAAELERFDSMAAQHRAKLGLPPMRHAVTP